MNKNPIEEKPLNIEEISLLEDSQHFMNRSIEALNLQMRRLESYDFSQENDPWEYLADAHFYITALKRLRQSVSAGKNVDKIKIQVENALRMFDETFSDLVKMRNILEHIDEYIQNKGHNKNIKNSQLYGNIFTEVGIEWAGLRFDSKASQKAANELVKKYRNIIRQEFKKYRECKKVT